MADVKLKFEGELGNTNQVITALEKKVEKLGNKLNAVSSKSRKGSNKFATDMKRWATGLVSVSAGYRLVQSGITAVIAKNKEFSRSVDQVFKKFSEAELKLQIQGGLTPIQLQKKLPTIFKSVLQTPSTDVAGALGLQTQLVSSGFKKEDIDSGEALQTVLDLKAATNQYGRTVEEPKKAVRAISQFVKAGLGVSSPSAANIRSTGGKLTQLFEGSDIQFEDLAELAKNASTLKTLGMSEDVQLAAFSALVDVKGGAEGSTGIRQVATRLRGASLSKAKVSALESIGLKPEDVDLIGESLPEALVKLREGASSVDEKTASNALQTLFGEKGLSAGTALIDKIDLIQERLEMLKGGAFERNLEIFQGSSFARDQRFGIREEFAQRLLSLQNKNITFETLRSAGNARQAELLLGAKDEKERAKIAAQATLSEAHLSAREGFGLTPTGSVQVQSVLDSGRTFNEAANDANERAIKLAEEQLEVLRNIEKNNPKRNRPINRNAHR